jgi:hypothetical protein
MPTRATACARGPLAGTKKAFNHIYSGICRTIHSTGANSADTENYSSPVACDAGLGRERVLSLNKGKGTPWL